MKALIIKEIVSTGLYLPLLIIFLIALSSYGTFNNSLLIIPSLCAMIPLILTSVTYGIDSKANFEQFAFSMPIKKSTYVLSKLAIAFAFSLIGAISVFVILLIKNNNPLRKIVIISLLAFVGSLIFSAVQLPFVIKYGVNSAKIIMVFVYLLIFGGTNFIKKHYSNIIAVINRYSSSEIGLLLVGGGLLIIYICIKSSIRISEKRNINYNNCFIRKEAFHSEKSSFL